MNGVAIKQDGESDTWTGFVGWGQELESEGRRLCFVYCSASQSVVPGLAAEVPGDLLELILLNSSLSLLSGRLEL